MYAIRSYYATFGYDAAERRIRLSRANGTITTYAYNSRSNSYLRITSYNVCYTKLLRVVRRREFLFVLTPEGAPRDSVAGFAGEELFVNRGYPLPKILPTIKDGINSEATSWVNVARNNFV